MINPLIGNIDNSVTTKTLTAYITTGVQLCTKGQFIPQPQGSNLKVGDVLNLGDNYGGFSSQVTVTDVDSSGGISSFKLTKQGQHSVKEAEGTANATPVKVANTSASMPCFIVSSSNQKILTGTQPLSSKIYNHYNTLDYGLKMDGSDDDNSNLQVLYNTVSNGSTIEIPSSSIWNGLTLSEDPTKHVIWHFDGNIGGWYPPPAGDGDTTFQTNSGNFYLAKRDLNTKNFISPVDAFYWNADPNYCGPWCHNWSQNAPIHTHAIVGPTAGGNTSTIAASLDSYGQAPSGDYDVGFSLNMNKYGQNSQWGLVVDMVDFSAKSPGAFADWNEWDIWSYGQDVKTWDPSYYKVHSGNRSLMYFNGHGLGKSTWTASKTIYKGIDKGLATQTDLTSPVVITTKGTDGIDYVWYAASGGITGKTQPTFPAPAKFVGQISNGVMTVTSVESGTINVGDYVTGAMPVWPVQILKQTSGTTGGVGVYTVSGTDGTAEGQPMYSAARVKDNTVVWQFGEEFASTIGSAVFLSADTIDYGLVYDTGTIIGSAALDTSVAVMSPLSAVVRMAPDQVIDFSSLNDKASRNQRTLSYSSTDKQIEFNQNGKKTFAITDDGTLMVNNPFGPGRVITTRNNNVNSISLDWVDGVVHSWIDNTLMGTIPKYISSAPSTAKASCSVGEVFDDSKYHYSCIAPNTWRRVSWDTSFE